MEVRVEGITQKGKNRVKEHGNDWLIVKTHGERVLLKSKETEYYKWGFAPDFKRIDK